MSIGKDEAPWRDDPSRQWYDWLVGQVNAEAARLEKRIEALESRITATENTVERCQAYTNGVDVQVRRLTDHVDDLEESVGALEGAIGALAVETSPTNMRRRIAALEGKDDDSPADDKRARAFEAMREALEKVYAHDICDPCYEGHLMGGCECPCHDLHNEAMQAVSKALALAEEAEKGGRR
jgi:uncharacterized coiled-coil protein SlyX